MSSVFVILAGILWGSMSIFVKNLNNLGFDSMKIMMVRSLITALLLGGIILIRDRRLFIIKLRDLWMFLCTGIVSLAFFSVCYFKTITDCGAGIAVILLYTSPVFVILLAWIFLGESINLYKILALILTVSGSVCVAGLIGGEHSLSAVSFLTGLGAGLGYGLYSIFGTVALKKYQPLTITFYTFLIAGLFMIPACSFFSKGQVQVTVNSTLVVYSLGVAVFCTLIPFLLYTKGLMGLEAGKAAIVATVEPVAGTLVGIFIWHEQTDLFQITGMILILISIFLCSKKTASEFLKKHKFHKKMITDNILKDMKKAPPKNGGQDMFKTWMIPPSEMPKNQKVIVIDAGGTNFRSCLVTFDNDGKALISDFKKTSMPAIEREYSRKEFFEAVADRIEYLRDKADKIGFCFSYAMEITKDHDGIPNAFSKEIKAREVLDVPVGKSLVKELEGRGWNKISKITLLNDTAAALLAGATAGEDYSSYIGFILGTGMNAAFVSEPGTFSEEKQIIVCESGKCNTIELSDFDIEVDRKTDIPGQYPLEKCCSGAYLGKVCYELLLAAGKEKIISSSTFEKLKKLKELTTIEADNYLQKKSSVLDEVIELGDRKTVEFLIDSAIDRCAYYAASILCANLIASGQGRIEKNQKPVCIVCNGTTLYKTHRLKERIEKYLKKAAFDKYKISYRMITIDNDITIGSAVAGLV